jgi:hypothetical protein
MPPVVPSQLAAVPECRRTVFDALGARLPKVLPRLTLMKYGYDKALLQRPGSPSKVSARPTPLAPRVLTAYSDRFLTAGKRNRYPILTQVFDAKSVLVRCKLKILSESSWCLRPPQTVWTSPTPCPLRQRLAAAQYGDASQLSEIRRLPQRSTYQANNSR